MTTSRAALALLLPAAPTLAAQRTPPAGTVGTIIREGGVYQEAGAPQVYVVHDGRKIRIPTPDALGEGAMTAADHPSARAERPAFNHGVDSMRTAARRTLVATALLPWLLGAPLLAQRTGTTEPVRTDAPVVASAPTVTLSGTYARAVLSWTAQPTAIYQVHRSLNPAVGSEPRGRPIGPMTGTFTFSDDGVDLHRVTYYRVSADFGAAGRFETAWMPYSPPAHQGAPALVGGYWVTFSDSRGTVKREGCVGWAAAPDAAGYQVEVNLGGTATAVRTPTAYAPRSILLSSTDLGTAEQLAAGGPIRIAVKVGALYPGAPAGDFWHGELVLPAVTTPMTCAVP